LAEIDSHRGELVQHVVDLHAGDRRALKARQEHAAQRVTEREAEAALEGLGHNRRLTRGIVARLHVELRRLDQFGPILVDHASLHSCSAPMSKEQNARGSK